MIRPPPIATRHDTLFPDTTRIRACWRRRVRGPTAGTIGRPLPPRPRNPPGRRASACIPRRTGWSCLSPLYSRKAFAPHAPTDGGWHGAVADYREPHGFAKGAMRRHCGERGSVRRSLPLRLTPLPRRPNSSPQDIGEAHRRGKGCEDVLTPEG